MVTFYLLLGLCFGFALANQTPINAKLGAALKSPFRSSLFSFSIGATFLLLVAAVITLLTGHFPDIAHVITSQPWWIWLGGVVGVIYLTVNILLFPRVGAVQTLLLPILGQILMSVAIDTFGWLRMPEVPLVWNRLVGVLLLLAGAFTIVVIAKWREAKRENTIEEKKDTSAGLIAWQVIGVGAGMLSAMQTTINGQLGVALASPVVASFISFLIGTIIIFVVVAVKERRFLPEGFSPKRHPRWIWLGGLLGALFVLGNTILVPQLGAGLTVLIGILGMMIGTNFVTQFGWWKSAKKAVNRYQIIGLALMLAGIVLIKLL
jgi:transporter family-2 protein